LFLHVIFIIKVNDFVQFDEINMRYITYYQYFDIIIL